ncbi:MAG: 3-methyl-2-oxobutanoate hydroxymethyltransferase [Betaproteobacteria bacterium]|nr:3-methyl-2-oxobutanoate hydroxymethyltransferase [Betaproteobacteria bacterium]
MSSHTTTRRLTITDLAKMKAAGDKIAMLTAYDASFARLCDSAGVDTVLVGDSLGMVVQGHDSTLPVTLADMVYHTAMVARGCDRPLIVTDMPFGTYQETPELAFRNAVQLMAAGAQMVKIEGGEDMAGTVRFLTHRGVPVCGHIGLTPQSVHQLGGYRVQGKDEAAAKQLKADALAIQAAGASLVVLEAIPQALASEVTALLHIPTIGIGASVDCSGQVLVLQDMLDIAPGRKARFVRNFMEGQPSVAAAIAAYVAAVKDCNFPAPEHCY